MEHKADKRRIDWMITLVPFILIMGVAGLLFALPEQSNAVISQIRFFFGDTVGIYYLIMGVGVLVVSLFLSFSKYGNIVLGEPNEKPRYSFFTWGSMMFTCVSITGAKMGEFIREVQPFILALIIALLLLTYIPGISLLLPNLIY